VEDLQFAVAEDFVPYVSRIRKEMVSQFGISSAEALKRINRHWGGLSFVHQLEIDVATHETPEDWASFIYYEDDVHWWLPGEDLRVRPYP
jgi:hypothetical protein